MLSSTQIGGLVMLGSKMGPNYASIFVGFTEELIRPHNKLSLFPQLHKCNIDYVW